MHCNLASRAEYNSKRMHYKRVRLHLGEGGPASYKRCGKVCSVCIVCQACKSFTTQ